MLSSVHVAADTCLFGCASMLITPFLSLELCIELRPCRMEAKMRAEVKTLFTPIIAQHQTEFDAVILGAWKNLPWQ